MRIAVIALCLLGLTQPAFARYLRSGEVNPCDIVLPSTIVEPSVKYEVHNVSQAHITELCGAGASPEAAKQIMGCTFRADDGSWPIYVAASNLNEISCIVQYEMAHMPPNYWGDPKMELPKTMKWLANEKAATRH